MTNPTATEFYSLAPHVILDAIDSVGLNCTGRCLQLNSLENRVYEVQIENEQEELEFVVTKFYRPQRWSEEQILAEHLFLKELAEADISVVCPMELNEETLHRCPTTGIFFTIFPKFGGRNLDEFSKEQAEVLGRTLARLHIVGAKHKASSRVDLTTETFGRTALNYLIKQDAIPLDIREMFINTVERLFSLSEPFWQNIQIQRIHGDAHVGNILNRDSTFYFVDFDDMANGPAIQDLWLLTPARDQESRDLLRTMLDGYQQLRSFDNRELFLIEPLRTLRVLHFTAWIHKRWDDQYFKRTFVDFDTDSYWREQLRFFNEQSQVFQEILAAGEPLIAF